MHETIRKITAAASAALLMLTAAVPPVQAEEEKPVSLLCFGDSITDGFWLPGGYRNTLCALISENGLESEIDFVGQNWGGSGYDPQHAGYSGYSIADIAQADSISGQRTGLTSFAPWLLETYPADLVFLQIGTNDILSLYDLEHFGERLDVLVDIILGALPQDGMLYLATLPVMDATNTLYINEYFFTVESMDAAVESCNAQIRALAAQKQAEGYPIQLADINGVLTKDDLYDGVHPNEAGYEKMGKFWYQRLLEYLDGDFGTPPQAETTASAAETTTTETTAEPVSADIRGDVNGDQLVNIADAVLLTKHLGTEQPLNAEQAARADMDENGRLNAVDLTLLKREIVQ